MKEIYFTLLILWGIDTILTFINLNKFMEINPEKDWINLEINPINRFFYKKLGLLDASILLLFITSTIVFITMNFITDTLFYIFCGMYLMLIIMHIDFYSKLNINKKKTNWRTYAIITLLILSFIDLCFTYIYLAQYSAWQPDKTFNQMESNPLILFFINLLGLEFGLLFSAFIIWLLLYFIGTKADWYIIIPICLVLIFAIIINSIHLIELHKLIILYPNG